MKKLPGVQVSLEQHLSKPIYLLQISQFAGHGYIFKSYHEIERKMTIPMIEKVKVLTELIFSR